MTVTGQLHSSTAITAKSRWQPFDSILRGALRRPACFGRN